MNVIEAVKTRKSIRAYTDRPVSRETIEEILELAVRAPSSMNTQPWEFAVVTGEVLSKIKAENVELLESGTAPDPDVKAVAYEGIYKQRQIDLAKQLFNLLEIKKEDKEKRAQWTQQGFRFFDAPAAIIVYCDRSLSFERSMYDAGAVVAILCLIALNFGLATCIQGQGIMYPAVVRRHTGIPETKKLIICVTIGYPDADFPVNRIQTERTPARDITRWIGF